MTTTHTPGPWKITSEEFVDDAKGGPVARIYSRQTRPADELKANAALIAAAPEMLEALNGLLEAILKCEAPVGGKRETLAAVDAARAAIAKAEGR